MRSVSQLNKARSSTSQSLRSKAQINNREGALGLSPRRTPPQGKAGDMSISRPARRWGSRNRPQSLDEGLVALRQLVRLVAIEPVGLLVLYDLGGVIG